MPETPLPTEPLATEPPRAEPRRGGRLAFLVTGGVTALIAAALLAIGGLVLFADSQKDGQGYLITGSHELAASTSALTSDSMDIDLDGAEWLVDSDIGNLRLDADSSDGKDLFVGIARTADVSAYLDGVAHTTVSDLDLGPFDATYRGHRGDRRAERPADQDIWAASSHGAGEQSLTWDVQDGAWSIVVMNADGSPGVRADVQAGAKVPFLAAIGWGSVGGGALLLLPAAGLVVAGARSPRRRPDSRGPAGLAPVAG